MNEIVIASQIAGAAIAGNLWLYLFRKERSRTGSALLVMMGAIFLYNLIGISIRYTENGSIIYICDIFYHILEIILWMSNFILIREILGLNTRISYIRYPIAVFVLILILRLTDPWLGLYYNRIWFETENGRMLMCMEWGTGICVYIGMQLLVIFALFLNALTENIKHRREKSKVRRKRLFITLVATMLPFLNFFIFTEEHFYKRDSAMMIQLIQALMLLHVIMSLSSKKIIQNANNMIMENMELGIIIVDKNYCYLESNRFARKLYPELENMQEKDLLQEKAPEIYEMFVRKETRRIQIEDGHYECRIFQVRKDEKNQGYAAGIYDVTEQITYLNELIHRRKKAEDISRRKSELLANASHEIRTPMNVILGMSELCLKKSTDPEITYGLRSIYNSGQGLLDVVESILDLSKSELEEQQTEDNLYCLERMLMEVAGLIETRLYGKSVEFEMELKTEVPKWVYGDRGKLRAVLVNLLGNSAKYTKEGKIRLVIAAQEIDENVELIIQVEDTGIGMKPEETERVFETFVRSKEAEEYHISGTGLGLALARQLVELMNGRIWLESRLGEGTTFFVRVNQKKTEGSNMKPGVVSAETVREYLFRAKFETEIERKYVGIHALVVDDLEVNTTVARGILELYGMTVTVANSGMQVLDILKTESFDIFFVDLRMPQMNGEELLRELRGIEVCANKPIIALTASNDLETIRYMEEAGFDAIMTKPIEKNVLEQILKEYFPYGSGLVPIESEMSRDRRRILNSYYLQISKLQPKLEKQLEENLGEFTISVHGIKGASLSIGALEMARKAEYLEKAGREERVTDIRDNFKSFEELLCCTLKQVKDEIELLENKNLEVAGNLPMKNLSDDILRRLLRALEEYELDEAEEILDFLKQYSYGQEEQSLLNELQSMVAELEYGLAIDKIKVFLGKIC